MELELLAIGNKIEFNLLTEGALKTKPNHTYYSQITDFLPDGSIQVLMPMEEGKMVLIPIHIRYEVVFYTERGTYKCICEVTERYKTDNLYFLTLEQKSQLEKIQRREFFRCECLIDVSYVSFDQKEMDHVQEKMKETKFFPGDLNIEEAVAVDISGGGIRLVTKKSLRKEDYMVIKIPLTIGNMNQEYYVLGSVVSCGRIENDGNRFENRIQFIDIDHKIQEEVIRYIFTEERKARKLSKG